MQYMSVKEAATRWGVTLQMVRRYCQKGLIPQVIQENGSWRIPEGAERPSTQTREVIEKKESALVRQIKYQCRNNYHRGIYEYIQVNLAYSSNRMASNRLTRDQVEHIFKKGKLIGKFEPTKVSDCIEVLNHFLCVDHIIDHAMNPLDVKLIRRLHYFLMYGSVDARLKRVSPGEFRTGPLVQKGRNSSQLPIPDESVDLVLTDPPYGGNVQYGELSAFWLAWIYDELGVTIDQITALVGEILIHRKNKVNAKTYQTYYEGLCRVYTECFRVLKKGQQLIWHKPVPIL